MKVTAPTIRPDTSLPSADMPALPSQTDVAANMPSMPGNLDVTALTSALSAKGVNSETAGRALYAYRRSMGMAASAPVLAGVN